MTLSLFSANSPTSTEQENFDFEKGTGSPNLLKCQVPRSHNDVKRSYGTSDCQDIQKSQDTKEENIHCSR